MKKISISVLGLICSLFVFELFIKFSPHNKGLMPSGYDKDIGLWHTADLNTTNHGKCYDVNVKFDEEGRVANSSILSSDEPNVILLGDSFVEGMMVNNADILHNRLAEHLKHKFNVLNYGLSGTSPLNQPAIYERKVTVSNQSWVVLIVNVSNDIDDVNLIHPVIKGVFKTPNSYQYEDVRELTFKLQTLEFFKRFYSYKVVFQIKEGLKQKIKEYSENQTISPDKSERDYTVLFDPIVALNNQTIAQGATLLVVLNFGKYENEVNILDFFIEQNIKYIVSNDHIIDQQLAAKELTLECDPHWNVKGHDFIARLISKFITKE